MLCTKHIHVQKLLISCHCTGNANELDKNECIRISFILLMAAGTAFSFRSFGLLCLLGLYLLFCLKVYIKLYLSVKNKEHLIISPISIQRCWQISLHAHNLSFIRHRVAGCYTNVNSLLWRCRIGCIPRLAPVSSTMGSNSVIDIILRQ